MKLVADCWFPCVHLGSSFQQQHHHALARCTKEQHLDKSVHYIDFKKDQLHGNGLHTLRKNMGEVTLYALFPQGYEVKEGKAHQIKMRTTSAQAGQMP